MFTAFVLAVRFLTILPLPERRLFTPVEIGRSVGFYPLVGLVLGGILLALHRGLGLIFPTPIVAALTLSAWVTLTRALHLDGFLDTCDGLFGGFSPERRLEIFRDSRVGAFAVIGGVLLLLTKFTTMLSLPTAAPALLLAPTLARWAMILAIVLFPYAREKGLGRQAKDHAGWPQIVLSTGTALAAAWFLAQWQGLITLGFSAVFVLAWGRYVLTLIPGLTGDIYGTVCELIELAILLYFTAVT